MERLNTKPITMNFMKRKSRDFFRGKEAILTEDLKNIAGEKIPAGSIVKIIGKNNALPKSCLDIRHESSNVEMSCVFCENLELITNPKEITVNNPEIVK